MNREDWYTLISYNVIRNKLLLCTHDLRTVGRSIKIGWVFVDSIFYFIQKYFNSNILWIFIV